MCHIGSTAVTPILTTTRSYLVGRVEDRARVVQGALGALLQRKPWCGVQGLGVRCLSVSGLGLGVEDSGFRALLQRKPWVGVQGSNVQGLDVWVLRCSGA
jgi:hypothetical protein